MLTQTVAVACTMAFERSKAAAQAAEICHLPHIAHARRHCITSFPSLESGRERIDPNVINALKFLDYSSHKKFSARLGGESNSIL